MADRFIDHAKPILAGDPALTQEERGDLWDIFHLSANPVELKEALAPLAVPEDTKARLVSAKRRPIVPADNPTEAVKRLAQIDPKALALAEAHPNVFRFLMSREK